MVTHTLNSALQLTHPKCTHTAVNTHTHTHHCEHTTGAVGSHLYCGAQGAVGVRCLVKGTSVVVLRGESIVHSLPPPTIPAGPRFELATLYLRV